MKSSFFLFVSPHNNSGHQSGSRSCLVWLGCCCVNSCTSCRRVVSQFHSNYQDYSRTGSLWDSQCPVSDYITGSEWTSYPFDAIQWCCHSSRSPGMYYKGNRESEFWICRELLFFCCFLEIFKCSDGMRHQDFLSQTVKHLCSLFIWIIWWTTSRFTCLQLWLLLVCRLHCCICSICWSSFVTKQRGGVCCQRGELWRP